VAQPARLPFSPGWAVSPRACTGQASPDRHHPFRLTVGSENQRYKRGLVLRIRNPSSFALTKNGEQIERVVREPRQRGAPDTVAARGGLHH
jgi:hypothetical protein